MVGCRIPTNMVIRTYYFEDITAIVYTYKRVSLGCLFSRPTHFFSCISIQESGSTLHYAHFDGLYLNHMLLNSVPGGSEPKFGLHGDLVLVIGVCLLIYHHGLHFAGTQEPFPKRSQNLSTGRNNHAENISSSVPQSAN